MKRPIAWSLLACAAILAYTLGARRPMTEPDEAAWIFSSYYYRLAFVDRDFGAPAWKHADALDHPPLAKFALGAALATQDLAARSLEAKERWFALSLDPYAKDEFMARLRAVVPMRALLLGRAVAALSVLALCALTALAGARAFDARTGAVAALLLALMPLARLAAGIATSDGLFAALVMACALAQLLLAERVSRGRAAAAGALAGLAFSTKILGAAELPLLWGALALSTGPRRARLAAAGAGTAAAVATALAVNPSLWSSPLAFVAAMFRHRAEVVSLQSAIFFGQFHQTPLDQLAGFLRRLFWTADAFSLVTCAATAVLAAAGLLALPKLRREPRRLVLGLHALAWAALCLLTFRADWIRYLLPALPFVCLLAAVGAFERKLWPAAAALALALTIPARVFTRERYWERHPELLAEKLAAQKAALAARALDESKKTP